MRKNISIVLLIMALTGIIYCKGFNAEAGHRKKTIYLCLDNSSSLKDKRFYENVVSHLRAFYNELEYQGYELYLVLFGGNILNLTFHIEKKTDDVYWWNFFKALNITYPTTDFVTLLSSQLLRRCDPGDKIVILTDGEHDEEKRERFSNFSYQEGQNLELAFNSVNNKDVYCIHLLHDEAHFNAPERSISFTGTNPNRVISNPLIIAGISKFMMKKLTRNRHNHYFLCGTNEEAFDKLTFLLKITKPVKPPKIVKEIRLGISFKHMPGEFEAYVRNYFQSRFYCIGGEIRTLKPDKGNPQNNDLALEIVNAGSETVNATLNGDPICQGTGANFYGQDIRFLRLLEREMLFRLKRNPRFCIPYGYINVFIDDRHIFAFIEGDQYQVIGMRATCGRENSPANVFLSVHNSINKGFLIKGPVNLKFFDFYLLNDNEPEEKRRIRIFKCNVSLDNFNYLSYEIRPKLNRPDTVAISFRDVFANNPGEIYIYAHNGDSFIAKLTAKDYVFSFFKDFRYTFYFVPRDKQLAIVTETRKISHFFNEAGEKTGRYTTLMAMLSDRIRFEGLDSWVSCLKKYQDAPNKREVIKEIVISDVFFDLFYHLDQIVKSKNYRNIFINLLKTINTADKDYTPFPIAKLYRDVYKYGFYKGDFLKKRVLYSDLKKVTMIADSLGYYESFFKSGILYLDENQNRDSPDERWVKVYDQLLK